MHVARLACSACSRFSRFKRSSAAGLERFDCVQISSAAVLTGFFVFNDSLQSYAFTDVWQSYAFTDL